VDVSLMMAGEQEHPIACDFIDIKVSGNYLPRVPLLILPHFLPDLPIYLVWDENPTQENPISQEMEKYASRIIFDSESAQNLQQFAKSLLKHKESYPSLDIADLNWARSEGWRELFADTFHSPERLEVLEKTQKIEIIYNKVETPAFCHTRIQPIYLQGWLSSQLNWKFIKGILEKEKLHFTYESPSGTVDVYLTPMTLSQKASSGMIFDVELISRDQDSFSFKRNRELLHQIDIQIATKDQCELPSQFLFTKGVSGRSLIREIYHRGTSSSFLKLLERLSTLDSSLC